ncbi:11086_t:CDS:1, partial [Scutellospora calospora]
MFHDSDSDSYSEDFQGYSAEEYSDDEFDCDEFVSNKTSQGILDFDSAELVENLVREWMGYNC